MLGASILAGLLTVLVGVLFLVPALITGSGGLAVFGVFAAIFGMIFVFMRFYVSAPAIVLERVGPIGGLRRSWALVRGRWWAMFGLAALAGILSAIVSSVISGLVTALLSAIGGNNSDFRFVWQAVGGTIAQGLVAPFTAAVLVLAYIDLRVRNEAFDLELLGQSIEQTPKPRSPYG